MVKVGISGISFYIPKLYVDLSELAEARSIPFEKLKYGLGLERMALPDINEDAASFAANALIELFGRYDLNPGEIGRIYMGTESAVDASKPTATYAVEALESKLEASYGPRSLANCDIVDLTFACIGAVDAMQNCLDWVAAREGRKAIVIASDVSKYELNSTGEYTQGAGAVAILLTQNPTIVAINSDWGVATQSVGDFFKPRRILRKSELFNGNLDPASNYDEVLELFKEEPVFDGQYSNQCYSDRVTEAIKHFESQTNSSFFDTSNYFVFHLPYAFHGRRIILRNWLDWVKASDHFATLQEEVGAPGDDINVWEKAVSKSAYYQSFVKEYIAGGEEASSRIGNMYTASIFMSLISLFEKLSETNQDLSAKNIGFIAYGSGSKSKVFQGSIQKGWKQGLKGLNLFERLNNRQKVDIPTYEKMHRRLQTDPLSNVEKVTLKSIAKDDPTKIGLRTYA